MVITSKHSALFGPEPPVVPSSQRVMFVLVATTVPLKGTQLFVLTNCGGLRSIAVFQSVEAVGLTLTRQVARAESPRMQPKITYVAPMAQPRMSCRTPPPPALLVL